MEWNFIKVNPTCNWRQSCLGRVRDGHVCESEHLRSMMLDMGKGEKPGCRAWRNNHTHVSSLPPAYVSFPKKSLDWPGSNAHISWHSILNYQRSQKKAWKRKNFRHKLRKGLSFFCLHGWDKRYVIGPSSCVSGCPRSQIGASGGRERLASSRPDVLGRPRAVMSVADQRVFWGQTAMSKLIIPV